MKSIVFLTLSLLSFSLFPWGFYAHRKINEYAVFCLPEERLKFYRPHLNRLVDLSVIPDIRKNTAISEFSLHYIDLERYHLNKQNFQDDDFLEFCEANDSCRSNGILPWHILRVFNELKTAIRFNQKSLILRLSGELGHYISDACVPLHTTENYDGHLTGQNGIHSLWESALPELFFEEYELYGIQSDTIVDIPATIWETIHNSHQLKDSVLLMHKELQDVMAQDVFGITARNNRLKADYSLSFKRAYHKKLNQMITKQLKKSILLCASMWETAWVEAERKK